MIPRILRHLSSDQSLTLVTLIISNFSQLQVCHNVIYPGTMVANVEEAAPQKFVTFDDVELFINTAAPALLAVISEAPLRVVNGLTKLFMEKNNIVYIARTKVNEHISAITGFSFMYCDNDANIVLSFLAGTCIFDHVTVACRKSKARWRSFEWSSCSVCRGSGSVAAGIHSIVQFFARKLRIHIPILVLSCSYSADNRHGANSIDDRRYVCLAIFGCIGHRCIHGPTANLGDRSEASLPFVNRECFVIMYAYTKLNVCRDRVMENIVLAHSNRLPTAQVTHKISNVNLFLHALGLDSSQVAIPR